MNNSYNLNDSRNCGLGYNHQNPVKLIYMGPPGTRKTNTVAVFETLTSAPTNIVVLEVMTRMAAEQ
jgi:hypothetical protein